MWRGIIATAGLVALSACVMAAPATSAEPEPDALLAPEIVAARVVDAYQAVLRLRPQFLRRSPIARGLDGSPADLRVFLDDVDLGGVEALHAIPLDAVTQIRYVRPFEAEMRWPGRHPAGVILVSTERTPR